MPSWIITCRQVKHWGQKEVSNSLSFNRHKSGQHLLGGCAQNQRHTRPTPWKNRQENKRRHMKWAIEEYTKRDHLQPAKQLRINFEVPAMTWILATFQCPPAQLWRVYPDRTASGFWVAWKKIRWHHWQSCISSAMAAANSALQSWKKLHKWRTSAARRQIHQVSTSKLQLWLPTRPPFRLSKDTRFRVASRISRHCDCPAPRNLLGKHSQFLKSCKFLARDSQKSYKTSFLCLKGVDSSRPEETRWWLPPRTFLRALEP